MFKIVLCVCVCVCVCVCARARERERATARETVVHFVHQIVYELKTNSTALTIRDCQQTKTRSNIKSQLEPNMG
jgi:hypothetical protein